MTPDGSHDWGRRYFRVVGLALHVVVVPKDAE